jgi:hypothetical protein
VKSDRGINVKAIHGFSDQLEQVNELIATGNNIVRRLVYLDDTTIRKWDVRRTRTSSREEKAINIGFAKGNG